MSARRAAAGMLAAVGAGVLACASHADALARGQRYYEDNQYERALALWRDLDRRGARFNPAERARFAYFRGMTDYRLGHRDDARHWLAIARATDEAHRGGLGSIWRERLDGALADLARGTSRAGRAGPDAVQTIEAPPGAAEADSADSAGPADAFSVPAVEEPRRPDPVVTEPGHSGRSAGSAPVDAIVSERIVSERPASDAGAPEP